MAGEDDGLDMEAFERQQTKEQKKGIRRRIEDAPPPGMSDDGTLNVVEKDAPAWKPKIVDADGNEVEMD
jgi:hypothetical protein